MQMIGRAFGYLLWWLYNIFRNYGVAIIVFTILVKLASFPLSIRQQRSMASQSRMAGKQKEIQARYPNDRQKQSEELQKLYSQEGSSPMSGCLTSLLPFFIMLGIFYAVISPLSNTLHIDSDNISAATEYITRIPGVAASSTYQELKIIQNFDALKGNLSQFFTAAEMDKIEFLSTGLNFMGLDLTKTPQGSSFAAMLWILPVLSLMINVGSQIYMQRKNPSMQAGQTGQGCMRWMMYFLPLLSAYYAYIMPGALGFYWIISGVVNFIQSLVTNQYFSVRHMTARQEASRAVTLELGEQKLRPLPVAAQQQIAQQLEAKSQPPTAHKEKSKKQSGSSKKRQRNKSNNSSQYQGNKK